MRRSCFGALAVLLGVLGCTPLQAVAPAPGAGLAERVDLVAASNAGERERVSRTRKLAADLAGAFFDAP